MSYTAKSFALYTFAAILGIIALAAVVVGMLMAFGAYSPDGLALMNYIYGISDGEMLAALAVGTGTFLIVMGTTVTVGENHVI